MVRAKYAVIGLGNFGLNLAICLTELGCEVLAIDCREERVELVRDKVAHALIMDATDAKALAALGLKDFDAVIVAIGEGFESSILTTAHLQELGVSRIVNRVMSPVHEKLLRLMNVNELIVAEAEAAKQLARRLNLKGALEYFEITGDYSIVEAKVPFWAVGKSLEKINLRKKYHINLVTLLRQSTEQKGFLSLGHRSEMEILGIPTSETVFAENDVLVLFGKETDIRRFLQG